MSLYPLFSNQSFSCNCNISKIAKVTKINNNTVVELIVNDLLTQRLIMKSEIRRFLGRKKTEVKIRRYSPWKFAISTFIDKLPINEIAVWAARKPFIDKFTNNNNDTIDPFNMA